MKRKQCAKCPWKVNTNPHDIPNGYSVDLHRNLEGTISSGLESVLNAEPRRVFACHEHNSEDRVPCVGWLHNQLGVGSNIGLRLAVMQGQMSGDYEIDGDQHESFEETLPDFDSEG